jgi:hypothetical protein
MAFGSIYGSDEPHGERKPHGCAGLSIFSEKDICRGPEGGATFAPRRQRELGRREAAAAHPFGDEGAGPVLSYTVTIESGAELMVVSVPRSTRPFHTFARDVGNFRAGQYLIREGSSTRPIMPADLLELYLKPEHGYVSRVLKQYGVEARRLQALSNVMNSYQAEEAQLRRQMAASVGLSPRDLGWE